MKDIDCTKSIWFWRVNNDFTNIPQCLKLQGSRMLCQKYQVFELKEVNTNDTYSYVTTNHQILA